jgi:cobalt-zinc-cadmium efflux system membrane fusion protein
MTLIERPPETKKSPPADLPEPAGPVAPEDISEVVLPSPRRSPSHWRQLALVAVAVAIVAIGIALVPKLLKPAVEQGPEAAKLPPGTFRPTAAQWAGLRFQTVTTMTFRPEQVTEGNIGVDDNLTTPVFSHYSGRVIKVIAMLGDVVKPGDPLFVIRASEFVQAQNDLITGLANLATARSQLTMAQTTEKRAHELYQAQGGALKDWQQAQTDLITAQNNVRSDEIALHAVRSRLRILGKTEEEIASLEAQPTQKLNPDAIVPAPIGGTITQRQIGVGQYINSEANGATNPVYTISDLSTVWLIANVREADAPLMRIGEPVEVKILAYPDRVFKAKISWIAASIDPNTRRLPVRADVENPDGALKPGMFATFSIVTGATETAPAVPQSAVVFEGETARVWVVGDDGTIAARPIRIGQSADGTLEVRDGLSKGDKVVTSGALFIDRAASSD